MKIIKKTTLIAAVAAMAAFAVPSMASAAGWAPLNTNKTLTQTSLMVYSISGPNEQFGFKCTNSTLGVHVRTPASSTIDITSASFTGCTAGGQWSCGNVTVTATGLPWVGTSGSAPYVAITEHLQVVENCAAGGPITFTVDGPVTGSYNNATHTLSVHPTAPMGLFYMGTMWAAINTASTHSWHETTNTLTLT